MQKDIDEFVLDSVLKRYKTIFIGNIDAVDRILGVLLWGHGKRFEDLTDNERSWLPLRAELRKAILDAGNKQMRDAEDLLCDYNFVPKR